MEKAFSDKQSNYLYSQKNLTKLKSNTYWNKGLSHPKGMIGKHHSKECKRILSLKGKKRKFSEETKRKMSIAKKIHWQNSEFRKKAIHPGKIYTEEDRKKASLIQKGLQAGNKHPNWKGGISYYRGKDWKQIRIKIWKRDDFTCQRCGNGWDQIVAHHIIPYRISKDNSFNNLITLCRKCHGKVERRIGD